MRDLRGVAALAVALLAGALALPAAALAVNDPLRPEQYGLDAIRAPAAWSVAQGEGIVIAVVDTGVSLQHPDLAPKLVRDRSGRIVGRDFVDPGTPPEDEHGHGTLVAGIAAAATANGIGIAGAAPAARILPVRVLDANGAGRLSDVDAGIRWAADQGAHVINLSLESALPLPGQIVSGAPDEAVRYAWEQGAVVVAAAGNSGAPFTDYAPSTPVLLVGATDRRDRQTTFSDSGRRDMVLAPGVDILSTWCRPCGADASHSYAKASGTSFAAPHAAAAVAILRSAGRSPAAALERLRETARPVPRPATAGPQGHGLIDVAAAVGVPDPGQTPPTAGAGTPAEQPTGGGERGGGERGGGTPPAPAASPAPAAAPAPPAGTPEAPRAPAPDAPAAPTPAADPPTQDTATPPPAAPPDEVALPNPGGPAGIPPLAGLAAALIVTTAAAGLAALRHLEPAG